MPRRYLQHSQQHVCASATGHDSDASRDDDGLYAAPHTRGPQETPEHHQHQQQRQRQSVPRASATGAATHDLRVWLGHRLWPRKSKTAQITTAPGQLGAGETETEADEPPRHLPTARIPPASEPLVPQNTLTKLLFDASRLLSVVPALLGASINAWCLWSPPGYTTPLYRRTHCTERWGRKSLPDRGDYFLAVLWCLALTTGLLRRWREYYHPLSTLIRLLALQAICWPATHFTLDILGSWGTNIGFSFVHSYSRSQHLSSDPDLYGDGTGVALNVFEMTLLRWATARPDVCWAVIGTTTCFSRSIQIWVTSNLLPSTPSLSSSSSSSTVAALLMSGVTPDRARQRTKKGTGEDGRKPNGRRWDWGVVTRTCVFPASLLYFLMAWVGAWRREDGIC